MALACNSSCRIVARGKLFFLFLLKTARSQYKEGLRRIFFLTFEQSDLEKIRRKVSWFPAASMRPRRDLRDYPFNLFPVVDVRAVLTCGFMEVVKNDCWAVFSPRPFDILPAVVDSPRTGSACRA